MQQLLGLLQLDNVLLSKPPKRAGSKTLPKKLKRQLPQLQGQLSVAVLLSRQQNVSLLRRSQQLPESLYLVRQHMLSISKQQQERLGWKGRLHSRLSHRQQSRLQP